jgi:4a-hydroxytetrahydrobiopterin dehydratase
MSDLASKNCIPCRGGVPPLAREEIHRLLPQVPGWDVVDDHHLTRNYPFKNFVDALAFVNEVGTLAEEQDHHPDVHLSWGKVQLDIWTHKIDGLTESDFIFAAKSDRLYKPLT